VSNGAIRGIPRGLGTPEVDAAAGIARTPAACLSCGSPLAHIADAGGTPMFVVKSVIVCTNPRCGGAWMHTQTMRPLKAHEVQRIVERAEARRRAEGLDRAEALA
jgi:hypothetical protein